MVRAAGGTGETDEAPGMPRRRLLDRTFDISIIAKGVDGLLEVIGGILLLVVSPATLNDLAVRLTQHELSRIPTTFWPPTCCGPPTTCTTPSCSARSTCWPTEW